MVLLVELLKINIQTCYFKKSTTSLPPDIQVEDKRFDFSGGWFWSCGGCISRKVGTHFVELVWNGSCCEAGVVELRWKEVPRAGESAASHRPPSLDLFRDTDQNLKRKFTVWQKISEKLIGWNLSSDTKQQNAVLYFQRSVNFGMRSCSSVLKMS